MCKAWIDVLSGSQSTRCIPGTWSPVRLSDKLLLQLEADVTWIKLLGFQDQVAIVGREISGEMVKYFGVSVGINTRWCVRFCPWLYSMFVGWSGWSSWSFNLSVGMVCFKGCTWRDLMSFYKPMRPIVLMLPSSDLTTAEVGLWMSPKLLPCHLAHLAPLPDKFLTHHFWSCLIMFDHLLWFGLGDLEREEEMSIAFNCCL